MFVSRWCALFTFDTFESNSKACIPLNLREHFGVETLLYCHLTYELFDLLSKISSNQFLSFII